MAEGLENSLRSNPNGDWPKVDPTAYIDPTAQVIGNVHRRGVPDQNRCK